MTRKFLEQYEENFHQYNFINEIYATLEGVKAENEELRRRKQGILDEIELKKTSRTYAESIRIHERIHEIGLAKDHLRQQLEEHK